MSTNQELLRTTSLKGLSPANVGSLSTVEAYGTIIERIRHQCGADVASLFAEPAMPTKPEPDNPQLTWYTHLDGQMLELASIDDVARRPVVARLRDRLTRLKPVLDDPEIGPTVASWLYVPSKNDVLSVGGNPVLINWGYLPSDVAASPSRREAHFFETIGRYAADLPPPPFTPQEAASYSARAAQADRRPSEPPGPPLAQASQAANPPAPDAQPSRFQDKAPIIAVLIAAAILVFLLLPGVLIFPQNWSRLEVDRHTDLLQEDNKLLAERLRELELAAKDRVCRLPDGKLTPLTPLTPAPGKPAPATPPASPILLPPPPDRIQVPQAPNAPATAPATLADLVDQAVVFVIGNVADDPGRVGFGTGFFVTRDRIVTNRHVIEKLIPSSIKVTNKAMAAAVSATVVARSPPEPKGSLRVQDLAILSVAQPGMATLKLGPSPQRGSPVIAVGYPGFIVGSDSGYQRLLKNDLSAAPESTVYPGFVIQKRETDPVKLVTHSANLGRGNSGGPLMDYCSRVVGVNTAVLNEGALSTTANLAQDVRELQSFLASHGVTPEVDDSQTPCPPAVAAAKPPANAPAPAAPPPKSTSPNPAR